MEALVLRLLLVAISVAVSTGATWKTRNFVVTAATAEEAKTVADAAEEYRQQLAVHWLGSPMPPWKRPCHVTVKSGAYSAAGHTTFQFVGREVLNWRMVVRGSQERILDSVLPHEVNHTIFACHFRRPLPRWADEGAATLFEHPSEQRIQLELLRNVVERQREFIPLRQLLSMKEYPQGHRPMLILYAEGFALVDFLIQQSGRRTYLRFLEDSTVHGWEAAIRKHYNHDGVEALERDWRGWVLAGMPGYGGDARELLALAETPAPAFVAGTAQLTRKSDTTPTSTDPPNRSQRNDGGDRDSSRGSRRPDHQQSRRSSVRAAEGARADSGVGREATFEAPAPATTAQTTASSGETGEQPPQTRGTSPAFPVAGGADGIPSGAADARWNHLQPTNHRGPRSPERLFPDPDLPWKRRTVTGSTPQWAGFPGQLESF